MNTGKKYKTRQRDVVLKYLEKHKESGLTIDEIYEGLKSEGEEIGKTTVYRSLGMLTDEGIARRYAPEKGVKGDSATFQYSGAAGKCNNHYHLKCLDCGRIIHLDCEEMEHINSHIATEHEFQVDMSKTVLYGRCKDCLEKD